MPGHDPILTPAFGLKRRPPPLPPAPLVVVLLECDRPLAVPSRHSLAEVESVTLRRAGARQALRAGRTLEIGIADQWMSGTHARLLREGDRFRLRDDASTNGSYVEGELVEDRLLEDGDLIEVGHTLLLFRAAAPRLSGEPLDLDASRLEPVAPFLATFSAPVQAQFARLATIARSIVPVVLGGETGSGKEVVARALHALSERPGPFVPVNCGAIARTLVETELFGYRKGAFSGAGEDRTGLVRSADGGTLFLDEIGDLPAAAQAALLRVLQEGEVMPVGATRPVPVSVRLLAATHMDLEAQVAKGEFRADLLARISGFKVDLPPLRDRREDLGILIGALLRRAEPERAIHVTFTIDAARALLRYRWPLNVRELDQCLRAALVLAGTQPIDLPHLAEAVRAALVAPKRPASRPSLQAAEISGPWSIPVEPVAGEAAAQRRPLSAEEQRHRAELVALLKQHKGNVTAMARALGKARMQVQRWLKRYELDPQAWRGG